MKKHVQILALLVALFVPWAMQAQTNTLTVANGTTQNQYVPVYSYYMDNLMKTQCIYPSDSLIALRGTAITELKFYTAYNFTFPATTVMSMGITTAANLTSAWATTPLTAVWTGHVTISNNQMVITLDNPFEYPSNGGNLLIQFSNTSTGTCGTSSDKFYGVSLTGMARYATNQTGTGTAQGFLPKCTFTYAPVSCPAPTGLTATNVTATGATLSFSTNSSHSEWLLHVTPAISGVSDFSPTDSTYVLTDLTPNTVYSVSLRAVCSNGDTSYSTSTSFRTPCVPLSRADMPYTYGFEDATAASSSGTISPCWAKGTNSATAYPYPSSSYKKSGNYSLYFYGTTSYYSYAVMPPVEDSVQDLQVLFNIYRTSTTAGYGDMQVGVMTDPTDITTFTQIGTTCNPSATSTWEQFTVDLSSYTGTGHYVAFRKPQSGSGYTYLDDITLRVAPTCFEPTSIAATMVNSTEVTIAWTPDSRTSAASYECEYDTLGFTPGTGNIVTAYEDSIQLSNLTPNTAYTIRVKAVCSGSDSSYAAILNFRTSCIGLTQDDLPYTYGFEDATATSSAGTINPCWSKGTNYTTAYPYPSATTPHSGTKNLYFYNTTTAYSYAVMQPYDDGVENLQLKFWTRASSASASYGNLEVGVMTNPTDISTFQLIATTTNPTLTWAMQEVSLSSYTGTGRYIAFRKPAGTAGYTYLDDIEVNLLPTCPEMRDMAVGSVRAVSANLTWDYQSGIVSDAPSFDIECVEVATGSVAVSQTGVTGLSYMLTGLTPATEYKVLMRASCLDGSYGGWDSVNFSTGCLVGGNTAITGTGVAGTTYYLPTNNFYNYSYTQQIILASELSGAAPIYGIRLKYNYATACAKSNCTIYVGHTTLSSLSTTSYATPSTMTAVYTGPISCVQGWNQINFTTPFQYNGSDNLVIAVDDNSGSYSGSGYVYDQYGASGSLGLCFYSDSENPDPSSLSSFSGSKSVYSYRVAMELLVPCDSNATCAAPNAVIDSIIDGTAYLSWAAGYQETSWDVDYRQGSTGDWTSVETGTAGNSTIIYGLAPSTDYQFRVGALCSDTTIYAVLSATTPCASFTVPFTEDFESYGTGTTAFPTCWYKKGSTADRPYIHATTSYGHNNSYGLYFYAASGGYCYAIMPPTNHGIDSLQVTLWARQYSTSYNCSFAVGVMSDPADLSTFVPVDTVHPASTEYEMFEVLLNSYTGNGRYIAFSSIMNSGSGNYLMLDDVTVDYIPSCPRVASVGSRYVSQEEATIYWSATPNATEYSVEYGPQGFMPGMGTVVNTYDDSIRLTNLLSSQTYDYYVTAICPGDDSSNTHLGQFTTSCGVITREAMPYTYGFEDASGTGSSATIHPCWYKGTNNSTAYPYPSTTYKKSGTYSLYFYSTTTYYSYLVMPPVEDSVQDLQVIFNIYRTSTTSGYGDMQVGVMTDPTDITTFTQIGTTCNPSATSTWEQFTVDLDSYTDTGRYIAFRKPATASGYTYLDDITLRKMPTCFEPTSVEMTFADSTEVTIAWTPDVRRSVSEYYCEYGPQGFMPGTGTIESVYDDSIMLSNLTPNTAYTIRITTVCTDGDSSYAATFNFRTECAGLTEDDLPYTYGFEDATATSATGTINPCWKKGTNYSTAYPYPSATTPHSGTKNLYFYSSTTYYSYAVMPAYNEGVEHLQVKFWTRASSATSTYGTMQVGVMTDPYDINTFQLIETTSNPTTTWELQTVALGGYTGNGRYIAFRVPSTASCYTYLDDIELDLLPSCPEMRNMEVSSIHATSANLTWGYQNGIVSDDPTFEMECIDESTQTIVATESSLEGSSYLLSGLSPNSQYKVRMRAACLDGSYGPWDSVSFATGCLVGGNIAITGLGTAGTDYYLPINTYYNYSYSQQLVKADEMNGASQIYGVRFKYNYSSAATLSNCTIYMGHTTLNSFTMSSFANPAQLTAVYTGSIHVSQGWNEFTFSQPFAYNGTDNLVIAIDDNSGTYPGSAYVFDHYNCSGNLAITFYDDSENPSPTSTSSLQNYDGMIDVYSYRTAMEFVVPCDTTTTCAAPNAVIDSLVGTDAYLSWAAGYQETSWDVDYRAASDSNWTNVATGTANTSVTISGLTPNTAYVFRVGALCSDTTAYTTLSATTPCAPFAVPFHEDFESFSSTAADPLPNCWDKHTNYTTNYPYASTSYHHSGSKAMYMYSTSSTYSYMVLPEFQPSVDSLQVSFWLYKSNTTYAHNLIVGVMTDPTDLSTFVGVDTVAPQVLSTWEPFEVRFNRYTGNGRYIAFLSPNGEYSYPYLDDLDVMMLSECPRVDNVTSRNVTTTDVTIAWDTTNAPEYEVQYGPSGFALGSGTIISAIYDDSVAITGLNPSSAYDAYVRGVCSSDTGNWSFCHTFRTSCDAITHLPFTEDFESYGTGTTAFPSCWYKLGSTADRPYVNATTSYGHNNTHGLYFYAASGGYCYAIMPPTTHSIDSLQVTLWARQYSTSYNCSFAVGVMSDPTDLTTFVAVDTVHPATTEYEMFEVPLNRYTDTGRYIAFSSIIVSGSYNYLMLDDVTLDYIPSCIHPFDLRAGMVTCTDATLHWTPGSEDQTEFVVRYGQLNCNFDTCMDIPVSGVDSIALTGLDTGSMYDFWVAALCDAGDTTPWIHITFRTLAGEPVSEFPYICTFAGTQGNAWEFAGQGQTNQWFVGAAAYNGTSDSMGLYVSNDNGVSNAYTNSVISYSWAYRTLSLTPGEYAYSFDWKGYGESSYYDYMRPFLVPAAEALTGGMLPGGATTYEFSTATAPAGWIDLGQVTASPFTLNMQDSWQTVTGTFTITETGTYNFAFVWANDGSSGTNPPTAVDNVYINRNTCPQVYNLTASSVTADSIYLDWNVLGSASSWMVTIDQNGTVSSYTTNDSSYVFGGLSPNTTYTVSVYSLCDAGDTSLANSLTLTTPCNAVSVPYLENFDSYTGTTSYSTGVYPSCWDYVLNGSSTYQTASYSPFVYNSSSYAHSGSNSLKLYGVGYFSLPPMDVPLNGLQISFWNYTTSTSYGLELGVMEGNTFVPVQDVTPSASSTHVLTTVYLNNYTGSSRIIAFRNYYTTSTTIGYSYHYLDDIEVDYVPTCMPVSNVVAATASSTSIDVDWTDNSTASAWEVRYAQGAGAPTTITATSHPVTLSGLDTLTAYNVSVRPICSATDTGAWSDPVVLMTAICDNAAITSTGTQTGTSYYVPVNNFYKYTLSEVIIDSAELGGAQTISAVSYYYTYTSPTTSKNNVTIYLMPTRKSTFSSTTDVVEPDSTAVLVYTGNLNCSQGWNIFQFDTTFEYDGTGNLMVIVDDNSNAYNSSTYTFASANCSGNKTLCYYSDSYHPTIGSLSSYSGTKYVYTYRPVMQLISCGGAFSCHTPVVSDPVATYNSVQVNWSGDGMNYEVALKDAASTDWPTEIPVTGNTYTFTGLQPNHTYDVRVRQDCDSSRYSAWVTRSVTTDDLPCFVPESLAVNEATMTNASAEFSWTSQSATTWDLHVWNTTGFDTVVRTNTNPTTVTGFTAGVTYNAAVRSVCDETSEFYSDYCDSIQFTTATCPDVTGLSVTAHTFNSATIAWSTVGNAASYQIEYGLTGFAQGQGTLQNVTTNSATLMGLTPEMAYDFYVRAICGEDWNSEHWTGPVSVTTDEAPQNTVTITAGANNANWGTVTGGGVYELNATVTLTATANTGYEFIDWNDGVTANPRTLTATEDMTLIANFAAIPQYTITVNVNDAEMGTAAGSGTYYRGEVVEISATANEGYRFISWNDGNGDNPRNITVTGDATYTATFVSDSVEVVYYNVTLTVNDPAMGTVTGAGRYVENSNVTIAAAANNGYRFVTWSDGNTDAERTFVITADVDLMATFERSEGIDDVNGSISCTIYPNPAHNTANISVSGVNGQVRIAVLDMSGREVASETMECSSDCVKSMDVDNLAAGTYFVRVISEQSNMVKKLIVR